MTLTHLACASSPLRGLTDRVEKRMSVNRVFSDLWLEACTDDSPSSVDLDHHESRQAYLARPEEIGR